MRRCEDLKKYRKGLRAGNCEKSSHISIRMIRNLSKRSAGTTFMNFDAGKKFVGRAKSRLKSSENLHERTIYASDVHMQTGINVTNVKFPQCKTFAAACNPRVITNQRISRAAIISVITPLSLRHPFPRCNLKVDPRDSDRRDGRARVFYPRLKT